MNQDINLKEIERDAFRATFKDGIYEMSWGLLLLGLGCAPLLVFIGIPKTVNIFVSIIPALIVQFAGKRYITTPRMGLVKFGPKRKRAHKRLVIFAVAAVAVTFGLVVWTMTGVLSKIIGDQAGIPWFMITVTVGVVLVVSVLAYFRDFGRMYLMAVFCGVGILASEFLYARIGEPMNSVYGMGVPGVVMLIIGVIQLTKFIRAYPVPKADSLSEGGAVRNG